MTAIRIEEFDSKLHPNPMQWVDSEQARRRDAGGKLVPYSVCIVQIRQFEFIFHSTTQLELCLEYYRMEHLPSTRLPVHTGYHGGDHYETQRWFERLPGKLRSGNVRPVVVSTLQRALALYAAVPGAVTGTEAPDLMRSY